MNTTATQADFYLPLFKYLLGFGVGITFIIAAMALIYLAILFFPYAKDR